MMKITHKLVALVTAVIGVSLVGRPREVAPVRRGHPGHDVHDWAHEAHPCDTESL